MSKKSYYKRFGALLAQRDQGYVCYYCGAPLAPPGNRGNGVLRLGGVDHLTPVNRGGIDAPINMVLACVNCNASKGNQTFEEFTGGSV